MKLHNEHENMADEVTNIFKSIKKRWILFLMIIICFVLMFLVGYYVGYNNAVVYMNNFIIENYQTTAPGFDEVINWSI